MNSDPDQLLNRLVVAALTLFGVVSLLLAAFVFREIWLQQRIVGLSSDLQVNIEDLAQITEEIQSEMSESRTTEADVEEGKDWGNVTELLENVDQQLDSIGENIDEVATVRDPESGIAASEPVTGDMTTADSITSDSETGGTTTDDTATDDTATDDTEVGESDTNESAAAHSEQNQAEGIMGAQAGQVFTIFTVLISLAAIAIAVLLGKAMRVQENASLDENGSPN